jgi:hypothetical protein
MKEFCRSFLLKEPVSPQKTGESREKEKDLEEVDAYLYIILIHIQYSIFN